MLAKELRQTITFLHQRKKSNREIVKLLKVSRNTVRAVLKQGVDIPPQTRKAQEAEIAPLLPELFTRCLGNAVCIKRFWKKSIP